MPPARPRAPTWRPSCRPITAPPGDSYSWEQLPEAIEALQNGDDIDYLGASGEIDLDENGDPTVGVYDTYEVTEKGFETFGEQIPAEEQAQ